MKFIFVDEAGTSDSREEIARVVAAVIVDADQQLFMAERLIEEAMYGVPAQFRPGFIFHAEDIMNNDRYRDVWRLTDRVNLICTIISTVPKLRLAVSGGLVWANTKSSWTEPTGLTLAEEHHLIAFAYAMTKADQHIREKGAPSEIGTVVAERNDLQRQLTASLQRMRENPIIFGPDHLTMREIDNEQGYNSQNGVLKVNRIRSTIHFVGKDEDPLVWIADAVAYGLKRFFSGRDFGQQFVDAARFGINMRDFQNGPSSGFLLTNV